VLASLVFVLAAQLPFAVADCPYTFPASLTGTVAGYLFGPKSGCDLEAGTVYSAPIGVLPLLVKKVTFGWSRNSVTTPFNGVVIKIYSYNANSLPGSLVATSNVIPSTIMPAGLFTLSANFSSPPLLNPGQKYIISASTTAASNFSCVVLLNRGSTNVSPGSISVWRQAGWNNEVNQYDNIIGVEFFDCTPSPTPSSIPSNTPSSTPSDTPSSTPSDTPSSVPSDTPSSTPSPTADEPVAIESGASAALYGDPHVNTWDGMTVTYAGCGDSILAMTFDASFMYQARTCLRGNDAASTCAIALRCASEGATVEVYATSTSLQLYVAGSAVRLSEGTNIVLDSITVARRGKQIALVCSSGASLEVFERGTSVGANYLDVKASLPMDFKGKVSGLAGQYNEIAEDDIVYRDGRTWNAGHGLAYVDGTEHPTLQHVQDSWSPKEAESLFRLTTEESNASCSDSQRFRFRQLLTFAPSKREAEAVCNEMGMTKAWLTTCMFDYMQLWRRCPIRCKSSHRPHGLPKGIVQEFIETGRKRSKRTNSYCS